MKKVIIDTNGLISFVTDRNLKQQQKIALVFQEASQLKLLLLCHSHVLSEFVYVLHSVYHCSNSNIHKLISEFIVMPGIQLSTDINFNTILSYWPNKITDYGDAIIAAQCGDHKNASILTFDKKFKKSLKKLNLPVFEF